LVEGLIAQEHRLDACTSTVAVLSHKNCYWSFVFARN